MKYRKEVVWRKCSRCKGYISEINWLTKGGRVYYCGRCWKNLFLFKPFKTLSRKFFIRKLLPAIAIIGLLLLVLYGCTFYDSHVVAELIPMKTSFAGSDICNDGIDVQILCVELLMYDGFPVDRKAQIIEGVEGAISQYPLTQSDLTVYWDGFELDVGLINYLGVVLYDSNFSVMETIVADLCEFLGVSWRYQLSCKEEDGMLGILKEAAHEEFTIAHYIPIETKDNGHLILVNSSLFSASEFDDPRYVIAHEYFHMYQTVHDNIKEPLQFQSEEEREEYENAFPTEGPMWFTEGTAEYAAEVTGREKSWGNFRDRLEATVYEMYYLRQLETEKYIKSVSISENITSADFDSIAVDGQLGSDVYFMSYLAVAYAVALSSHDAVMIDYWDDLKEYGAKESFKRNVGLTFEEFQIRFEEFLDFGIPNKQLEIVMGLVVDN